jgi:hypothetical protein
MRLRLGLRGGVSALAAGGLLGLAGCGSAAVEELPAPAGPSRAVNHLADGRSVVLLGRQRVVELRDARGRRVGRAPAGVGPTHVACLDRGATAWCYVTDTRGQALLVFAVRSGIEARRRLYLPGDPGAMTVDRRRGRLLVTLDARHELVELPAHGRPHVLHRRAPRPSTGRR